MQFAVLAVLTSVDVIVEGRQRVGRSPAGCFGVHHGAAALTRHGTIAARRVRLRRRLRADCRLTLPWRSPSLGPGSPADPRRPRSPPRLHFRTVANPSRHQFNCSRCRTGFIVSRRYHLLCHGARCPRRRTGIKQGVNGLASRYTQTLAYGTLVYISGVGIDQEDISIVAWILMFYLI